ncbi:MAG: response regulator, partial [Bacteroidetes bacterium]|nr:response regulator [Fibrella sp.]
MKTILVIEDAPAMRENIAEILQLAAYRVVQAANGKEGIERARQVRPDLILCDITMPGLDGFGVLHIMGQDPDLAHIPFIFLTAKAEMADFRLGMNLGADDYLTKPIDDLNLLNAVTLRLRKNERGQQNSTPDLSNLDQLTRAILDETNARQSLCDHYLTTHYRKKQILFTSGTWPTALYFINRGKIKLFKTDAAGNEYITGLFGAGDFVGYLPLLKEAPYAETAELLDDTEVCTIPKADFMALIYHRQDVANRFIQVLTSDVTELQEQILKLAYQSVRKRVAEALLMFQRKFYPVAASTGDGHPNRSPAMTLSRENWSHLVGASTETVIRILGDLRAEGLIDINASQITLLDIGKLTAL